jgi:hypothetical protein
LDRSKFGANFNPFEINLIRFENRIGHTVLPTPTCQRHADRLTTPHPATDDWAPVASRPTCQSRRPRRADPVVLQCGAATRRRHAAALLHVTPRAPLSLPFCLHAASTPLTPLPALPLKTEPPAADRSFSSPARRLSRPSTSARRGFVLIAQASTSPVFRHRSPSSASDSVRPSPLSAPLW